MTNAEAAVHFASLPPNTQAEILMIDGDTLSVLECQLDSPNDTVDNLSDIDPGILTSEMMKMPSIFLKR